MTLGRIQPSRKTGDEPLHDDGRTLNISLQEFWQWSGSDLVSNTQRGVLAEFLVARAVGDVRDVRTEWDSHDVETASGIKVEVKASGFVQSWSQERLSRIEFDIAPKRSWDAATNESAAAPGRPADVYVFAVHAHREQESIDPLNVNQWEFYVVATRVIDERCTDQKKIAFGALQGLCPDAVPYDRLGDAVSEAMGPPR